MPLIRNINDIFSTEELTSAIINIPNTSGFIKSMNLFDKNYTDQTSVSFDLVDDYTTLLHDVNRNGGSPTRDGDVAATSHSFNLAYFHDAAWITEADFRSKRRLGSAADSETLQNIAAGKLVRMKGKVDLTHEYMMLKAANGVCTTPDGLVLADMFTTFGISRPQVDFDFGGVGVDITTKIGEVIDLVAAGLETGGAFAGDLVCPVNNEFFNKLITHESIVGAYLNSTSNARYRDNMSRFTNWGAVRSFTHQGLTFVTYNYSFPLKNADGTITNVAAIPNGVDAAGEGFVLPELIGGGIFEAWYGPSRKINGSGGEEMFVSPYTDPEGYFYKLNIESSPLFFPRKPKTLVRLFSST